MAGPKRLHIQVARYITNAGNNEVVKFRNGDPLDLRLENLVRVKQIRSPHSKPRKDARAEVRSGADKRRKAIAEGRKFRCYGGCNPED